MALGHEVKKSELIRAGLLLLCGVLLWPAWAGARPHLELDLSLGPAARRLEAPRFRGHYVWRCFNEACQGLEVA